ncbi:hypothetical protein ACWGJW_41125, partial [Streptomyces nigrescens]
AVGADPGAAVDRRQAGAAPTGFGELVLARARPILRASTARSPTPPAPPAAWRPRNASAWVRRRSLAEFISSWLYGSSCPAPK